MMCKRHCALRQAVCLLLTVCLLLSCLPARATATHMLVISTESAGGDAALCMQELRRLALYNNWNCVYQDAADPIDLTDCEGVILCIDEGRHLDDEAVQTLLDSELPIFVIGSGGLPQLAPTQTLDGSLVVRLETEARQNNDMLLLDTSVTLLQETGESLGGTLFVASRAYPLCQTAGQITHLAYFDPASPDLCTYLASCLQLWKWPYDNAPRSYGQYLVLDNVYPFDDPAQLMAVTDMLEEENVPYALAVMPLYSNAEYPTMKRFCEYLTYVQSRGAGIILHAPLVTLANTSTEDVQKHLEIAYLAYANYGVYPLAIEVPESWLLSEKGLSLLSGFRTVFMFATDEPVYGAALSINLAWRDGHQLVAGARTDALTFTNAYAQAIYLDVHQDVEALREQVQRIKRSRRTLKSLTDMENIVYIGSEHLHQSPETGVRFNGEAVELTYTPFVYDADYRYDRGFVQNLTEQIEEGNKLILTFVLVACTFFITAIVLARRSMRQELLQGHHRRRGRTEEASHGEEMRL